MDEVAAPATYADLVARHAPALLRLAVMLTGDAHEAEDLLQAALVKTFRHGDRIAAMGAPAAYLRKVLTNEHLSRGRMRLRRVRTVPTEHAAELVAETGSSVEVRDEVWRWLATLPRQQRAVLVLRFYEDLDDAEIAEILGCAEVTVRSNVSRGLASLRARLTQEDS